MTGMCLALSKSNDYSEYNIIGEEKLIPKEKFIPKKTVHNMIATYVNSF